jgi:hypothetical protein
MEQMENGADGKRPKPTPQGASRSGSCRTIGAIQGLVVAQSYRGVQAGFSRSVTHQNTSTSKVRETNDPVDGLNGVALESVVYVNVGGNVAFL